MRPFWDFSDIPFDRHALIMPGSENVSFGELSRKADAWSARLRTIAGDRVPVVLLEFATSCEAIAAYLGVLRCGYPLLILESVETDTAGRLVEAWEPDIHLLAGASGTIQPSVRPEWQSKVQPAPHADLRLLLSTSGSTGDPKLVRLSANNIASNARSIVEYLEVTPADRGATTLPLFYSYGLSVLNSYLAAGAALVLTDRSVTDPLFFGDMRAAGATSLALVPHQFDLLTNAGFVGSELPTLRYMTQAGGKLDIASIERFAAMGQSCGWRLFIMYGQTEAAPRISYVPPEALPSAAGTIGRAIPGGRLWLAAENGSEITTCDKPGELIYEGPNVMMGYALSRADLALGPEVTQLHTGDIAERTSDGFFQITGRLKRFVKLYGLRLSLDQIETLLQQKGISAHAVAVDDKLMLMHSNPDQGDAACHAVTIAYNLPEAAVYTGHLAKLPLLSSGKPDHRALHALAKTALARASAAKQSKRVGESISDIMRRATRRTRVMPDDSFISLGGDSLSYIQVQMALEEHLGAAPEGWEEMTVARLEALAEKPVVIRSTYQRVRVGIEVLLRLIAISMVVAQHASNYPLYGGTWILIAVMGYSVARFQMQQIADGQALRFAARMLYPIVPFYFLLLAAYGTLRDEVPFFYWLLLGNYTKLGTSSLLDVYWFVSLYAQIIVILATVISVRSLRQAAIRSSWRAAALVSGILVLYLTGLALFGQLNETGSLILPYYPQRGLLECLTIFALGWMLRLMQSRTQVAVTFVVAAITVVIWIEIDMTLLVASFLIVALALLALNPVIMMPRPVSRWINRLASVTLFVYLLHMPVLFVTTRLPLPQMGTIIVTLASAFLVALLLKRCFDSLESRLMTLVFHSHSSAETQASKV